MQQKKTAKYECHYPLVAEDSAYHYTNCNWQYGDSLRTYHAKYKDSVAVDYDVSKMKYIYVAKGEDYNGRSNKEEFNEFSHNLQYWIVPSFFAIMFAMIIFAFILYRDNGKALKEKRKDSILNMMKDGNS